MQSNYVLAVAIKAWNATKAGRPMKSLRFATDEDFPLI
jgi:hypothetical protein